jgi:hypothetical protein
MAAQKEKDKQIELVLAKIYHELKKLHSHTVASRNLPDLVDGAISGGSQEMPAVEVDSRVTSNNAKSGVAAGMSVCILYYTFFNSSHWVIIISFHHFVTQKFYFNST